MKKLQYVLIFSCFTLITPNIAEALSFTKKGQEKDTITNVIRVMHKDLGRVSDALRKAQDKLEKKGLDQEKMRKLHMLQEKVAELNREAGKVLTDILHDV